MFLLIANDTIHIKANDEGMKADLRAEGSGPFEWIPQSGPRAGETLDLGYWRLPDAAMDDPAILRERIREQSLLRADAGLRPLPPTSRLLDAMDHGLPSSSGNALGVDRLIMLALGKSSLADVIAFPFDRA